MSAQSEDVSALDDSEDEELDEVEVAVEDLEEEEVALAATDDDDEESDESSLEELLAKRSATRKAADDPDEEDDIMTAFAPEQEPMLPETLPSKVIPVKDRQEFVCARCHLVKARSQLADAERGLCRDCV
ncbi:MAG: hypothetical protein QOF16_469 [Actinomycetota bacterium]|nr:hypothetical protein [Actinomycetota bacterium]